MVTIPADRLAAFVADVFMRTGSSPAEARRIGDCLVAANLCGHDSHGVIRVTTYLRWLAAGHLKPDRTVAVLVDTPSLAVVDGRRGYGQTVGPQAVTIGIGKCRENGLAAVALRNAGHVGRIGDWAEMAAAAGLVSIHFVNAAGSVLVAPFGGVERKFSTAPYCVGIPRPGLPPIVLDFATSIVAEGKVMVASRGGKPVPQGALIAADGRLSDDPAELYGPYTMEGPRDHSRGSGAIRAFGEHKGSGLALVCELLGGALSGNGATRRDRPTTNGWLAIYIDPARLDPDRFFDGEVARYVADVKSARPAAGVDEVLIPGEPEQRTRAERLKNGVPLPDETWAAIAGAARTAGVTDERIRRVTA